MSRTRSITTETTKTATIQISTNTTGSAIWSDYAYPNMGPPEAAAKCMVDEITSSFKVRQARGEVIMNPCESWSSDVRRYGAYGYDVRRIRKSDGVVDSRFAARCIGGNYTTQFRYPRTMIPDMDPVSRGVEVRAFGLEPGSMTDIEQGVLAEALDKATGPETLALVTAAELNKTVALMSSAVKSANAMAILLESLGSKTRELNQVLRRLAKLRKKALMKQFLMTLDKRMGGAASAWLVYRYGIMATVYDLESWVDASRLDARRTRVVASRMSEWSNVPDMTVIHNWMGNEAYGRFEHRVERRRRTVTRAGVLISTEALTNADRFGINRVASTAWELGPLSFVLDWLVDTGTRISAMEGNLLVRPLGSWITHEHQLQWSHPYRWYPSSGSDADYNYVAYGQDAGVSTEVCQYRVRIPNPRLSPFPAVKVNLNWKRLLDSVSLLAVLTKRIRAAGLRHL